MQKRLVKKTIVEPSKHFPGGEPEFSDWLNNHLDEIGDLLGLRLEKGEREAEVGPFSADIVAKNVSGDIEENTVIENQFNETDHDHLGKLITYSTRYNAKKIIWVAPDFVPKHIDALNWLNQNSSGDISFFGVKLELIRIEDSKVAHNFSVVVQPADWTNEERAHGGLKPLLMSSNPFGFVPVGNNLNFEFRFFASKINKYLGLDIDPGYFHSRPHIDLKPVMILLNRGRFKGYHLILNKVSDGSYVPKWYDDKEYNKIVKYVKDEANSFTRFYSNIHDLVFHAPILRETIFNSTGSLDDFV